MTRPDVGEGERECLDVALEKLGIEVGNVTKRESPDFSFEVGGRVVGLEIVQARDSEAASTAGARGRIKRMLQARLEAEGLLFLVWLSMTEGELVMLEKRPGEIRELVDAVAKLCGSQEIDSCRYNRSELKELGIHGVKHLSVSVEDETFVAWAVSSNGQRGHLIQRAIDKKAELLGDYREAISEVWLLVVAGLGAGASIDASEGRGRLTSPFDRTFFLEAYEGICFEIAHQSE